MALSNGEDNYDDVCKWHGDQDHQSLNFAYIVMLEGDRLHISSGYHAEEEKPIYILCDRVRFTKLCFLGKLMTISNRHGLLDNAIYPCIKIYPKVNRKRLFLVCTLALIRTTPFLHRSFQNQEGLQALSAFPCTAGIFVTTLKRLSTA